MVNAAHMIGITDTGEPIIPADGLCEHWSPGKSPTIQREECWYCRWADFRKTTEVTLEQSACRCPRNHVNILHGNENEGGKRHA